ncbi:MAG: YigZ family protein [Ignavibacteria bacterium]|nr:YigZ family protein [Ignavibacteria bacterium]
MSQLPFKIKSIKELAKFQLKEKGSLFVANAIQITDEKSASSFVLKQKKAHFNANHNCFAYLVANGNLKYSDDGEPNGTAGIRILNAINHFKLKNICVVVTRYFGGTKLGIGSLGKTYYKTAFNCLENANTIEHTLFEEIVIEYDFQSSNQVFRLAEKYQIKVTKNSYRNNPHLKGLLPIANKLLLYEELNKNPSKSLKVDFKQIQKYL